MSTVRHAIFFKQDFEAGYRYLDRCGEFLVIAQHELGLIPTGEQTPSGGTLEAPELGLKVETNTMHLRVTHEMPGTDLEPFRKMSLKISHLYRELFKPEGIEKNGIATTSYIPFKTWEQVCNASLRWSPTEDSQTNLGRSIGMTPQSKTIEYAYENGSKRLIFKARPVTFENVRLNKRNVGSNASRRQKDIAARQNLAFERIIRQDFAFGLYFEADLTEDTPPPDSFEALYAELLEKESILLKQLTIK